MNVGHFSHEGGNVKHILHQDQFLNWMLENKTEQNKPKTMLAEISRYNARAISNELCSFENLRDFSENALTSSVFEPEICSFFK